MRVSDRAMGVSDRAMGVSVGGEKRLTEGMEGEEMEEMEGGVSTHSGLEHVQLSVVWEGALACGGGHVLCLTGY